MNQSTQKAVVARPAKRSAYRVQGRIEEYLLEKTRMLFEPVGNLGRQDDAESLHRMRVTSRRLHVGLQFFSELFSQNQLMQVQRQLRRIGRALGEIRTLDVNIHLLRRAAKRLPSSTARARASLTQNLLAERAARMAELRELMNILTLGKLELHIRTLIATRSRHFDSKLLLKSATEQLSLLRRAVRRRYKQYRKKGSDRAFHQLRIAAKRYRYGLEAARAVFQIPVHERIRAVEELQDVMGDCHDIEVLMESLNSALDRWGKEDKNLAEGIATMLKFFKQRWKEGRSEFEKFLAREKRWLKKVKLSTA